MTTEQELERYKTFFYTCFEQFEKSYPAPSITNEYDCTVIYDTIKNSENWRTLFFDALGELENLQSMASHDIATMRKITKNFRDRYPDKIIPY